MIPTRWMIGLLGLAALGVMAAMLSSSYAHNALMQEKLSHVESSNQANLVTIATLMSDEYETQRRLKERQHSHQVQQDKLNEDIKTLKALLEKDNCYQRPWPDAVTKRLREPY